MEDNNETNEGNHLNLNTLLFTLGSQLQAMCLVTHFGNEQSINL